MRYIPMAMFTALVALLLFLLMVPHGRNETFTPKPLPPLSVKPISGTTPWQQKQLLGKVTVINFFASWCMPCAAEMPEMVALKKQVPAVRFVGIAWNDEPKTIDRWLTEHGKPFHSVWTDTNGDATIALGVRGIPETLIVDGKGVVRYRLSGPLTEPVRKATVEPLLKQLLAENHAH